MFKGPVLRAAREKAGYTLIGLSDALKKHYGTLVVDYTTLSQWEISPTACPRIKNVQKVANFLNIPVEDLYDTDDKLNSTVQVNKDILDLIEIMIRLYKSNPEDPRLAKVKEILM